MLPESTRGRIEYDVITLFATAEVDSDRRPGLAEALRESRTQLSSQTGYLMRFGDASHRELTVFDVVSLPIKSYPVSESAYASLPDRVREQLQDVGAVQIVGDYDSEASVFRDVVWPGAESPGDAAEPDETTDDSPDDRSVERSMTAGDGVGSDAMVEERDSDGSAQTYRPITRREFETFLEGVSVDFERKAYGWTDEWVYESILDDGEKCLRVYSSIDRDDNASRGAGSDAIKSVLLLNVADDGEEPTWRPLRKPKRTYRIQTWPQNLREKLERAVATKDELKVCSGCDRPMVLQSPKGKNRRFWGCSGYYEKTAGGDRACENTAPVQ
jgi:hypothetical protein